MLGDLVLNSIERFFSDLVESCINFFLQLLSAVNETTVVVLDMPVVNHAIIYSQLIAGGILVVKFGFEVWQNYILRVNGDMEADLQGTLVRLVQAAGLIGAIPWITKQVYLWGTAIANDIALLPGTDANSGAAILQTLLTTVLVGAAGTGIVIPAVAIVFALVVFLIVLVQTFIRAAELAVVAAVGAFMAIGWTNPESQTFQTWWRELLNISLAQAIQMFLIKCSFFALTVNPNPSVPLLNVFIFAGFIWVTYKSPSVLKQYLYSTGAGRAAGQGLRQAGSMVVMRKLLTKGV